MATIKEKISCTKWYLVALILAQKSCFFESLNMVVLVWKTVFQQSNEIIQSGLF